MTAHWSHQVFCGACVSCRGTLADPCLRPLLVISLWQPWAILAVARDPAKAPRVAAPKENETRHWTPKLDLPYRVVVHAAKKFDGETRSAYHCSPFYEALERCGFHPGDPRPLLKRREVVETLGGQKLRPVPLGALVGMVTILEVVTAESWRSENSTNVDERAFGNYGDGRFAWRLVDPFMFPTPIPFQGRQDVLYPLDQRHCELVDAQRPA